MKAIAPPPLPREHRPVTVQKRNHLLGAALAVALQIAALYVTDPRTVQALGMVGGLLYGWLGIRRPGDAK